MNAEIETIEPKWGSCEGCPFYLFKEYVGMPGVSEHRGNYCAHPAYIESWGIEQFMGATGPGEPREHDGNCILLEESSVESVIGEAVRMRLFWSTIECHGPTLSPASQMHPHHEAWKQGKWKEGQ